MNGIFMHRVSIWNRWTRFLLLLVIATGFSRVEIRATWLFDDDLRQWKRQSQDEEHPCVPPPDSCCIVPGAGGPGSGPGGAPGSPGGGCPKCPRTDGSEGETIALAMP